MKEPTDATYRFLRAGVVHNWSNHSTEIVYLEIFNPAAIAGRRIT